MAARRSSMTTCARCGRCLIRRGRFSGRSIGRGRSASSICGSPRAEIPVGHGQTRRGWVVVACLGYSRAGAGALIFSKQTPDLLFGIRRCLWSLGALPETLVWDRQAGLHAGGGRPTEAFAAFCGAAAGRLALLRAARSAGQGRRRAAAGLRRAQLRARPACSRTSSTTSCSSTPGSMSAPTRGCTRRCAAGRSTGCSRSAR